MTTETSVKNYIARSREYLERHRPAEVVDLDLKRGVDELREAEERREFRHVEQVMEGSK